MGIGLVLIGAGLSLLAGLYYIARRMIRVAEHDRETELPTRVTYDGQPWEPH